MMTEQPLVVFDSGIGGLTVLRELRVLIQNRHVVYFADDAGFPYGDWEKEALAARIITLFGRLIADHDPAMIVVACNTASTLVLSQLRQAFPDVPIVGTVPAIKPAAERTRSGLVSVLATPGTVKRAYTRDLIESFAAKCHVRLVGSEKLAKMAEDHIRGVDIEDRTILDEILPCFVEKDGRKTDIVVLACTHYPFLANEFRRLAPWPVDWLDPAEAIARRARSVIGETGSEGEPGYGSDVAYFTSGDPGFATRRLIGGFGLRLQAGDSI